MKQTGKTKSKLYKGVYHIILGGKRYWKAGGCIKGRMFGIFAKTEREAALKYDKKMIEKGKPPINILKRATI